MALEVTAVHSSQFTVASGLPTSDRPSLFGSD